jgi:cation diffusion facilitator CzcD-associated flavoprotein CzcO
MALGFTGNTWMMKLFGKVATLYIRRSINDETLRKKVTPGYVIGCKRVLLSNDYYPAIQSKNVDVITEGIREVNETGVLTSDGKQHNVETIVLATGFQAAEGMIKFEVKGKNGIDLNEAWSNGAEAYLGTSVSGFPNLFFVIGPNTGLGHSSMILMIEAQVNYIMGAMQQIKNKQLKYVDVKKAVQTEYNKEMQQKLNKTVWQSGGCVSWYQTKNGKNVTLWPGFTFTFMKRTKKFEPEKYELVS